MKFNTLDYIETGKLAVLKLNRPEKRNAMDAEMIAELKILFNFLKNNETVVLLQIVGKGDGFCAGADISWLKSLGDSNALQIQEKFQSLAEMLQALYTIPQISVSFVHGSAYGGGLGLLACSDFVISSPQTIFSFSEIKLGLIPATISPYVINKTGLQNVKKLFYTGERFDENKALEIGLIDQIAQGDSSNLYYETLMETILKQPHQALLSLKKLLRGIESKSFGNYDQKQGIELISELIASNETQKLFNQFLSSTKPN
jgi:methylglutaconyl-CoA hydratase